MRGIMMVIGFTAMLGAIQCAYACPAGYVSCGQNSCCRS
jgi:hypothetical protein